MHLELRPGRVFRALTIIALALTLVSFATRTVNVFVLHAKFNRPIKMVDIDEEASVPTWFSSMDLALTSLLLLGICATLKKQGNTRFRWQWALLGVGFLVLSVDEAIAFHELTGAVVKKIIPAKGIFRFAWIAWALVLMAGLAVYFLKFVLALEPRRRRQFIVAGGLFVFAAVLMEMVGGKLMDCYNSRDALAYIIESHIEEFLEMFAIILFNTALLEHLGSLTGSERLTLHIGPISSPAD